MANLVEKIRDYWTSAEISREGLRDKLSEFLAVERGGVALYTAALRLVFDREVASRFRVFRDQTRKHERVLLRVTKALGMHGDYMSATAESTRQKTEALLKTMITRRRLSARAAELNAIENIVLAETKDHADWEFLGRIARQCQDPSLREVLQPAVSEVEPQEDEHLNWTKRQLARLGFTGLCEKVSQDRPRKHRAPRKALPTRSKRAGKERQKKVETAQTRRAKPSKRHKQNRRKAPPKKTSRL